MKLSACRSVTTGQLWVRTLTIDVDGRQTRQAANRARVSGVGGLCVTRHMLIARRRSSAMRGIEAMCIASLSTIAHAKHQFCPWRLFGSFVGESVLRNNKATAVAAAKQVLTDQIPYH